MLLRGSLVSTILFNKLQLHRDSSCRNGGETHEHRWPGRRDVKQTLSRGRKKTYGAKVRYLCPSTDLWLQWLQENKNYFLIHRLAFVVIGIIGMWFVSWSPYAVVALLGVSGQSHLVTPLASMVPALFCKTASCLDPYVYAVTHPRFRSELHHLTKRSRRKRSARQWSPQHRSQIVGPRINRVPDGLDNGVEEVVLTINSR